ncbi:Wzz/FepE/Etk N-terminal domain-containing protein [Spiribacter vilamensis]|uniref:LPS O-antigen subunit length determinant protein (WzzB/FepE family) n=1 Tax=Spiribacter vilamensis TaxID=531306 RepID=A0A4Q8D2L9_9GAMM|nr:Wzz/FepE/Etk N-terminal domain-containing protein [Spiribacter vilamensis]RZU99584.1 LPS O-antigen subunit length determinant protein (WzzB/FepE family) [Spiribacter vilamensis]TVO61449.1 hypothetical protein FPL09_04840 [Spiribacter vilamensis]
MNDYRAPVPADDEISLFELWDVLVRRRRTIIVVFILAFGITAGYGLLKEPVHRLTAVMDVGRIPNLPDNPTTSIDPSDAVAPLEAAGSVVTRLNEVLIPRVREENSATMAGLPAVNAGVADSRAGLIRLTAEAPDSVTEDTQTLMTRILDVSVSDYRSQWQAQSRWLEDRIDSLERREAAINSRMPAGNRGAMDEALGLTGEEGEAAGTQVMHDLITTAINYRSEAYRWDLDDELSALRMASSQMAGPRIEREPAVSESGIGASTSLLLALGAVLGLMLGVFAAFIREFLFNARQYREQPDADQT